MRPLWGSIQHDGVCLLEWLGCCGSVVLWIPNGLGESFGATARGARGSTEGDSRELARITCCLVPSLRHLTGQRPLGTPTVDGPPGPGPTSAWSFTQHVVRTITGPLCSPSPHPHRGRQIAKPGYASASPSSDQATLLSWRRPIKGRVDVRRADLWAAKGRRVSGATGRANGRPRRTIDVARSVQNRDEIVRPGASLFLRRGGRAAQVTHFPCAGHPGSPTLGGRHLPAAVPPESNELIKTL